MVLLENTFQTCMFCERHYYFQNGVCQKCELLSAWSDGRKDFCHTWPLERTESLLLFLGPAAVVLTIFIAWEIITAPLTIVEAKSTMADDEKVVVMLPIVISIAATSGNELEHIVANNQWNIAAELGTDPMSSAFARVLTHGPREVAMVLDKEDIFNYIVSELGSLECMDEQIRSLMGDMLVNNLTNVGRATEDLLKELGQKKTLSYQGSARVEALSSFESSELPAP
eukprot:Skav202495  [mRNA]  locus=scaffold32:43957:50876:- [translate_table: standard]